MAEQKVMKREFLSLFLHSTKYNDLFIAYSELIKVLCEQTHELTHDFLDYV